MLRPPKPSHVPMPGSAKLCAGDRGERPLAAQIAAQLARLPGATLKGWMAESCIGSYPLEVVAARSGRRRGTAAGGAFLVLSVELAIDGVPWLGAAPGFRPGLMSESVALRASAAWNSGCLGTSGTGHCKAAIDEWPAPP